MVESYPHPTTPLASVENLIFIYLVRDFELRGACGPMIE